MRRRSIAAIQVRLMHRDEATIHRRNPSQTDAPSNITCASATFVYKEHACAVCGHNAAQTDAPSNITCAAMTSAIALSDSIQIEPKLQVFAAWSCIAASYTAESTCH